MRQAAVMLLIVSAGFLAANAMLGYSLTYDVGYGAVSLMAMMISLTFLWLWRVRATPLALGMSFSWAGTSSVLGWWWGYSVLERPAVMNDNQALFLFLSLTFTGAILHFQVIQRSIGLPGLIYLGPVAISIVIAAFLVVAL
ncbi:MAG: hypothetical protein KJN93_07310 [Alphaproteobacteria bacterium]|nr:hypothetical protein [Alphaproteobacteria bacterium]